MKNAAYLYSNERSSESSDDSVSFLDCSSWVMKGMYGVRGIFICEQYQHDCRQLCEEDRSSD